MISIESKLTTLLFYRHSLKSISKLADPQIRFSLRSLLLTHIRSHSSPLKLKSLSLNIFRQKIITKWLSRCLQQHQNSLSQLIRIKTKTTPLEYRNYMVSRPLIQLEGNVQYKKLGKQDRKWVKEMVLKCVETENVMWKDVWEYLGDARSQDSWDWRSIPYQLTAELVQEIQRKVNESHPYHYQYRSIFQHMIQFKQFDSQHILNDLKNSNYWIL